MTDQEIYILWHSKTNDLRYLRPRRWLQLKKLIQTQQLKSVLEFGSGISTLLLSNLGMKVLSVETNLGHMKFVERLCPPEVDFIIWDNMNLRFSESFDLVLIDGAAPRTHQLRISLKHAPFIAVDDFEKEEKAQLESMLTNCKRIDDKTTTLAIFKQRAHG